MPETRLAPAVQNLMGTQGTHLLVLHILGRRFLPGYRRPLRGSAGGGRTDQLVKGVC